MKNTAEFIHRAAHALLKDVCGVEGECDAGLSKDYMTFDAGGECA